jgi:hypothetical protein
MRAITEPEGPPEPGAPRRAFLRRLGWFFTLAAMAAAVTAGIAYALKALLPA